MYRGRYYGTLSDLTVLIDFSGKTWGQREEIFHRVNAIITNSCYVYPNNEYVTVLSFGEKLNVHRYWQHASHAKSLEKGEWKREVGTAFYDALIEAMRMAYKRTGALANSGVASIEFIVFSDGVDTHSVATKEDVKKALEFVMGCPGFWQFTMESVDGVSMSLEESLGIELDYVESLRHPWDYR